MSDMPDDTTAVDEAADADARATQGDVPGRDGGPVDEGDMQAADGLEASPSTARAYGEMLERGKDQKGEGRV